MIDVLTPHDINNATNSILSLGREIIPQEIIKLTVPEWAEKHRIITQGFHPGPFSYDITPYLKEIAEALSPSSPVREIALMKGSRMGATVAIGENWIGYWIATGQGPFGYATADAESAGAQMELRIDELINTAGIGHLIGTQEHEKRKHQKTTGDRTLRKRFPGGYIFAGGPNAAYFKRQFGFKGFYGDEIDADAWEMAMKDGDKIYLIRRRLSEFPDSYKALWTSSPKLKHNSNIYKAYKEGDQRKYFVPCKHCGHMQFLRWGEKDKNGGIRFDHDEDDRLIAEYNSDGEIIKSSVRYECEECGGEWTNADKDWFLPRGEWRPTAEPRRPGMRSYHLPALLAPVGSVSWEAGVVDFLTIKHNGFPPMEFQVWVNTYLGEPFEVYDGRSQIKALLTREKTYIAGTLPNDAKPLLITIGADVQGGKNSRIECEVVAWGRDFVSWSINYHVIPGDTSYFDKHDTESMSHACWSALRGIITKEYNGMLPSLTGIDSGYNTETVYSFCDTFDDGVHPVMGQSYLDKDSKKIKIVKLVGHRNARIDVNDNLLKQDIEAFLKTNIFESGRVPGGYCYFPSDYSTQHYIQLRNEYRVIETDNRGMEKVKWVQTGKNEQLDCRKYALAMVYAYYDLIQDLMQKKRILTADGDLILDEDETLPWDIFWDYLEYQDNFIMA